MGRGLVVGVAVAVLASCGVVSAWGDGGDGSSGAGVDVVSAEAAALREAAVLGSAVEVGVLGGADRKVMAQPGGELVAEVGLRPFRERRGGRWVDADPEVLSGREVGRARAGVVRARSGGVGVLSRSALGGVSDVVGVSDFGGGLVDFVWESAVGAPDVVGEFSIYRGVQPDVDVVVEHQGDVFSTYTVIHTREAARRLVREGFVLGWDSGAGLVVRSDGGFGFEVVSGDRVVGRIPRLLMWDASGVGAADGVLGVVRGRDGARWDDPRVELEGSKLRVFPAGGLVEDPDAVFPLVVDPTVPSASASGPGSYVLALSNKGMVRRDVVNVGYDNYPNEKTGKRYDQVWRTTMQLPLGVFKDRRRADVVIHKAELKVKQFHSTNNKCHVKSWLPGVRVWTFSGVGKDARYSSVKPVAKLSGRDNYGVGHSPACGKGVMRTFQLGAAAVTKNVQKGKSFLDVGLRSENESDLDGWRSYRVGGEDHPRVYFSYHTRPSKPAGLAIKGSYNKTSSGAVYVQAGKMYTFTAKVSDPDGHKVKLILDVANGKKTKWACKGGRRESGWVPSGGMASVTCTVSGGAGGYFVTGYTKDVSGLISGGVSAGAVSVQSAPPRPAISPPPDPVDLGDVVRFKVGAYPNAHWVDYSIKGEWVAVELVNKYNTFTYKPSEAGPFTVRVRSRNLAGGTTEGPPVEVMVHRKDVVLPTPTPTSQPTATPEPTATPSPSTTPSGTASPSPSVTVDPVEPRVWAGWRFNGGLDGHFEGNPALQVVRGEPDWSGDAPGAGFDEDSADVSLPVGGDLRLVSAPVIPEPVKRHTLSLHFVAGSAVADGECVVAGLKGVTRRGGEDGSVDGPGTVGAVGLKNGTWHVWLDHGGATPTEVASSHLASTDELEFDWIELHTYEDNTVQIALYRKSLLAETLTTSAGSVDASRGEVVVGSQVVAGRVLPGCVGLVDDVSVKSGPYVAVEDWAGSRSVRVVKDVVAVKQDGQW